MPLSAQSLIERLDRLYPQAWAAEIPLAESDRAPSTRNIGKARLTCSGSEVHDSAQLLCFDYHRESCRANNEHGSWSCHKKKSTHSLRKALIAWREVTRPRLSPAGVIILSTHCVALCRSRLGLEWRC